MQAETLTEESEKKQELEVRESRSTPIVVGNWKMYKVEEEAKQFLDSLTSDVINSGVVVGLAVPFTTLSFISKYITEKELKIRVGAQNMNDADEGAFTGEVAGKMLLDVGAKFVVLGHSERRSFFNETSEFINKKVKKAIADNLSPILCIGETLNQRTDGLTEEVLADQLEKSLKDVEDVSLLTIAYEPVWAIGTGNVATAEDIEKAMEFCNSWLVKRFGDVANGISMLYGGSVKPENAAEIIQINNVNGFLVGGASLSAESFQSIISNSKG